MNLILNMVKQPKDLVSNTFIFKIRMGWNLIWLFLQWRPRNATKYGGVAAFTGGLIGDKIYIENYKGDFDGTPVFIGTSDPDPHVPVERVYATANTLKNMNAIVTEKVYSNMGHTINEDEIKNANDLIFI